MSKNKVITDKEVNQEKTTKMKFEIKMIRKIHQILILSFIHLFYILIESMNQFGSQWISSTIYSLIAVSTIVFLWIQKENYNYLLPIPFISLIVVGGILEETITSTVIFALYCIYFFVYQFIRKSESETIMTVLCSGITMLVMICFTLFDQGFVKVDYELNVILFIWFIWNLIVLGFAFIHKDNIRIHLGFLITVLFLSSVGTFFGFILEYDNVFAIVNGLLILVSIIISLIIVFREESLNLNKFLIYISINLVAVIIYSFSFKLAFDWLNDLNKMLIVDYVLFIPLVLITSIVFSLKYYPEVKAMFETEKYYYSKNDPLQRIDLWFLIIYVIFQISALFSLIDNIDNFEFVLLKSLIISIIIIAASIPLNIRITTMISLVVTSVLFVIVLLYVGDVGNYASFISLLSLVGVVYIFLIFNELFLIGEPLTTNLAVVATLVGMITSILFFYIEDMTYKEIWTSMTWAFIGIFLFAFGIVYYHIFLRRSGFIVILFDILYSIISISINYRGWQMGVAFLVLAIVLLVCTSLLRWSEKRESKEKEVPAEELSES